MVRQVVAGRAWVGGEGHVRVRRAVVRQGKTRRGLVFGAAGAAWCGVAW